MTKIRTYISVLFVSLCLVAGCKSKLEEGGPYSPGSLVVTTNASGDPVTNFNATAAADMQFYITDGSFSVAYATVDALFKFEETNRDMLLRLNPKIKATLDDIRPRALDLRNRYIAARKVYKANPTPDGLSDLQSLMNQLQRTANAAQTAIQTIP